MKHLLKIMFVFLIVIIGYRTQAQDEDTINLIQNPGAEEPLSTAWETIDGDWQQGSEVTVRNGRYHFFAGESSQATIFQHVDVSAYADAIDAGEQSFHFEAYVRSYSGFAALDSANVFVIYWDGEDIENDATIFESGEYFNTAWTLIEDTRLAPPGTRMITVVLMSIRYGGYDNDGYFDDIALYATDGENNSSVVDNASESSTTTGEIVFECSNELPGTSNHDDDGCPAEFDEYAEIEFDDRLHEAWYERFWTGSCENVTAFCFNGVGWHESIDMLLERLPEEQHGYARNRMWALGRAVGFDWARDNAIGAITTGHLQRWGNALDAADTEEEIYNTMEDIEEDVCQLLGADYIIGGYTTAESCESDD